MPEMIEKLDRIKFEKGRKENLNLILAPLKKEIKGLVEKFSAETFKGAKKNKTEKIVLEEGTPEKWMEEYPAKKHNFREKNRFKKLNPEKQEVVEFELMKHIHETSQKKLLKMHNGFFKTLSSEVREYFEENGKRREKSEKPLLPPRELEEEVINTIEEYKNQFGFPPGSPHTLGPNCAGFTNFVGKIFEHYGFKSAPLSIPGHLASLVELKRSGKHVSDIEFSETLPFRKWIEKAGEMMGTEIKLRDIALGYFGGYESGVHYNLGIFLDDLNQYDKAEREYREAIEIDPNNAESHHNLGVLLEDLGKKRFPDAEKEYKEAIKIDPNYVRAYYNLGHLYRKMREFNKARNELLKARELYEGQGNIKSMEKCDEILEEIGIFNKWFSKIR